jgi:hypothetical protein
MNDQAGAAYQRAAQAALAAANPIEPVRLTVISDSMRPVLRTGDTVRVQPIDPAAIRVDEIVVVRRGADLITHRLIDSDGDHWITRGDNAIFADAPIVQAACLGRVIAIENASRSIDLAQPRWVQLNHRLGRLGRAQRRIQQALHLTPTSALVGIRLAWLIGLPFRALAHIFVRQVRAD